MRNNIEYFCIIVSGKYARKVAGANIATLIGHDVLKFYCEAAEQYGELSSEHKKAMGDSLLYDATLYALDRDSPYTIQLVYNADITWDNQYRSGNKNGPWQHSADKYAENESITLLVIDDGGNIIKSFENVYGDLPNQKEIYDDFNKSFSDCGTASERAEYTENPEVNTK